MKMYGLAGNIVLIFMYMILPANPLQAQNKKQGESARGAESHESLSNILFQALQMNDESSLIPYIPGEEEIKGLQAKATERNKPFFESLQATEIQAGVTKGFDDIIRKGIEKNINWSAVELVDYETTTCSLQLDGCNVTFTIEDQNSNRLVVNYDAIKVNERWYIFSNLGLGTEGAAVKRRN